MRTAPRLRRLLATVAEGELVPFLSLWLLVGAVVVTGFDYAIVVEWAPVLFYAVLVGIWTSLSPTDPLEEGGNYAQFEFLLVSSGALVLGAIVEWGLGLLSGVGTMFAVQALALTFLGSRLYVNSLGADAVDQLVRWDRLPERYLVYVPCVVAVFLPVLLWRLGVTAPLGRRLQSPEGVLLVAALAAGVGALALALDRAVAVRGALAAARRNRGKL